MKYALKSLLATVLAAAAAATQAAVAPIDFAGSIVSGAAPITFSEIQRDAAGNVIGGGGLNTVNPAYQAVGPGSSGFTTGSFFVGQLFPQLLSSCPGPGGTAPTTTNCVTGAPTPGARLTLAPSGTSQIITEPGFGADSPILSGSGLFGESPIAILFAQDVSAVSFLAGGFNNIGNTRVQVFSRTGDVLATAFNPGVCPDVPANPPTEPILRPGVCPPDPISPQFFNFAFSSSVNEIAGFLISVIGIEEFGFGIDNVRTLIAPASTTSTSSTSSTSSGDSHGQVPEPTSLALVGLALLGLGLARLRRA